MAESLLMGGYGQVLHCRLHCTSCSRPDNCSNRSSSPFWEVFLHQEWLGKSCLLTHNKLLSKHSELSFRRLRRQLKGIKLALSVYKVWGFSIPHNLVAISLLTLLSKAFKAVGIPLEWRQGTGQQCNEFDVVLAMQKWQDHLPGSRLHL